jgi:hypothetical protein
VTAAQLASQVGAKLIGKNAWIVLCPCHGDHTPSLRIAVGKRHPVVLVCLSQGCKTKDILAAWGLRWDDICNDKSNGKLDPSVARRVYAQIQLEKMERAWVLAEWAGDARWKRYREKAKSLVFELYPERKRAYDFQVRVRREGWDKVMEEWMQGDEGKEFLTKHDGGKYAGVSQC